MFNVGSTQMTQFLSYTFTHLIISSNLICLLAYNYSHLPQLFCV